MLFEDRREAGRVLAGALQQYANVSSVLVLALPRGGVPVAYEVAKALHAPLDVFVVRKLGAPGQEELALGAIAAGGVRVLNREVVRALGITPEEIERISARELLELERRERQYRGERPPLEVAGRIIILVDDGLATGSTVRAAASALRAGAPAKIVVAVPVAARATCEELRREVDEVICAATPDNFFAVGQWYRHFEQTSDEEVRSLLESAAQARQPAESR
jgi:putative phosphoribosyl transferase